jgi:hypothetical protein
MAEKAVSEIRGRSTMIELTMKQKMMLLIGSWVFPNTPLMYLDPGNTPSRLKANTIRVVTVM